MMSEQEWLENFSDNLQILLKDANMSQNELAEESGLSKGTISKYIHKTKMPGAKALINIAYALDCTLEELMDFGEPIY